MKVILRKNDAFDDGVEGKVLTFFGSAEEFRLIALFLQQFADECDALDHIPDGPPHSHLRDYAGKIDMNIGIDLICYADLGNRQ